MSKKIRNKISKNRKKRKKFSKKTPAEQAIYDAQLITFNRRNHPSTKFKNIVNYAEIQKNFLTPSQKQEK